MPLRERLHTESRYSPEAPAPRRKAYRNAPDAGVEREISNVTPAATKDGERDSLLDEQPEAAVRLSIPAGSLVRRTDWLYEYRYGDSNPGPVAENHVS